MNQFFKYPWLLLLEDGIQKKKSQDPDLDTFLPTEGFDSKPLNLDRIRKIMQVNLVFKSQTPYPLSTKKKENTYRKSKYVVKNKNIPPSNSPNVTR